MDEVGIEVAVLAVPVAVAVDLGFQVRLMTCKRARALHDKKPVIEAASLKRCRAVSVNQTSQNASV